MISRAVFRRTANLGDRVHVHSLLCQLEALLQVALFCLPLFSVVFWPRCGLFAFILVKRMMLVWSQPWDISERAPVAHHSWARDENSGGHPTATLFFGEGSFSVVVGSAFKIGIGSESWKIGVGSGSSREWKLERRREWHTDA